MEKKLPRFDNNYNNYIKICLFQQNEIVEHIH